MTGAERAAAVAGLGAGAAAIGLAGLLLHRTLGVALEIGRYAGDIATAATALRGNTDLAAGLGRLQATAGRIRAAVGASTSSRAVR